MEKRRDEVISNYPGSEEGGRYPGEHGYPGETTLLPFAGSLPALFHRLPTFADRNVHVCNGCTFLSPSWDFCITSVCSPFKILCLVGNSYGTTPFIMGAAAIRSPHLYRERKHP